MGAHGDRWWVWWNGIELVCVRWMCEVRVDVVFGEEVVGCGEALELVLMLYDGYKVSSWVGASEVGLSFLMDYRRERIHTRSSCNSSECSARHRRGTDSTV